MSFHLISFSKLNKFIKQFKVGVHIIPIKFLFIGHIENYNEFWQKCIVGSILKIEISNKQKRGRINCVISLSINNNVMLIHAETTKIIIEILNLIFITCCSRSHGRQLKKALSYCGGGVISPVRGPNQWSLSSSVTSAMSVGSW